MQVGANRIKEIVESLRNFSRLDESEVKNVDIHEGIDSTLMILQNNLKAQPHELEIEGALSTQQSAISLSGVYNGGFKPPRKAHH
uniref:hypothetical protein n=1 Tax=Okeania sp. SIO2F4 TaxID=2607790 RepID=UPI0035C8EFF3